MNIKELRTKLKMSQDELADALNINRSRIAKWETGVASPKAEDYNKLVRFFTSKGVMELFNELDFKIDRFIKLRQSLKENEYSIVETNTQAAAGQIELINDEPFLIVDPIKFGELNDVIGVITASGNSMYPTIANGSRLPVKRLMDKTLLVPGRIYMVIDTNYSQFVKRVYEDLDGIILSSDNKTMDGERRQYPDFKRKWEQVAAIYEVKGTINLF